MPFVTVNFYLFSHISICFHPLPSVAIGSSWISKYKKRLLEGGIIEETILGNLTFALPGFAEYLNELGL